MMMEFAGHLRRQWFVVARSSALRDKPVRVFLLGWPMVLARSERGTLIALEDRCPHRGVPLSDGRIGPKGLACRFHGWTFDESGRCSVMPGESDTEQPPGDIRVPSFAVMERDGLVWAARSKGYPLPDRLSVLQPGDLRFVWETRVSASVLDAQDNILKVLLALATRGGTVPGSGAGGAPALSAEGDGFRIDQDGQSARSGLLFRLFESGRTRERTYFSSLSVAQLEYWYANGSAVWITLYFSPESLVSTRVFATLHTKRRWVPSWLVKSLITPALRTVELQAQTPSGARSPTDASFDPIRTHLQQAWVIARI